MKKILLVEDDYTLNEMLAYHLNQNGYHTTSAHTEAEALERIADLAFDLILLDIALPDGNGFTICKSIRELSTDSIIIFLTANNLENSILKSYNVGADDYITKPFSLPILLKKIAAFTNRIEKKPPARVYSDSHLQLNFETLTALVANNPTEFTPMEFKLLELLIKNSRHIVTRQIILDVIWDKRGNYVEESSLNSMISRIRSKIDFSQHHYIKTIYGTGYMWIAGE